MEREQNFIEKILKDAQARKEEIKKEALLKAQESQKEQEKKEKEFINAEKKLMEAEAKRELENEKNNSMLEQNKQILSAKKQILDEIFELVLQKMKKISAKDYQLFLTNILTAYAEPQDGLIISARKGEKEKIEKLSVFKKKKLKVIKESKEISGGIIIVNDVFEQDFSFEALVSDKMKNYSYKIAKQVF